LEQALSFVEPLRSTPHRDTEGEAASSALRAECADFAAQSKPAGAEQVEPLPL
jgi:hypothetical protein